MSKSAFRRPQVRPRTVAPSPSRPTNSSDISSPDEEVLEGKLLEEVEHEERAKKPTKAAAKTKATPKTVAEKKKPGRPSLPSLPDEVVLAEPIDDKLVKKTKMTRVGSFEVGHAKKPTAKPPVIYKKRASERSQPPAKSKSVIESTSPDSTSDASDDDISKPKDDGSSYSDNGGDDKTKKRPVDNAAAVENDKKRSRLTSPASPISEVDKANQESAASNDDPHPGSQRPSRTAKEQGTKRLAELAAYDLDAVAAEEGGSAGVLLDAFDAEPEKEASDAKCSPHGKKTGQAESDEDDLDFDVVSKATQAPKTSTSARRKLAGSSPVSEHKGKKEKVAAPPSPRSSEGPIKGPQNPQPKPRAVSTASHRQRKSVIAPPTPGLEFDPPAHAYDKQLILRMLIAKLESSRTCDWYELSAQLNKEGIGAGMAKKGKKGELPRISGDQLYELYHNVVLPGLKVGKALWKDDASSASSPDSQALATPQLDDLELPVDYEGEEEEHAPTTTKSRATKPKE